MRTQWFFAALVLSILIAGLHWWALTDFLYWKYIWLDLPIHFLGGLTLGVLTVAFLMRFKPFHFFAILLAVAIGWEVFEYVIGTPQEAPNYLFDTSLDLLMDAVGATAAYLLARISIWRSA